MDGVSSGFASSPSSKGGGIGQGLISMMGLIAGQTELRDKNDLLGSKLAVILECRFLRNIYRVTAKYYRVTAKYYRNSSYSYIP